MRPFFARTFNSRLILSHLLVALVSIALISVVAGRSIYSAARQQVEHHYEDLAYAGSNKLETPLMNLVSGNGSVEEVGAVLAQAFPDDLGLRTTIFAPDGTPLYDNQSADPGQADPATAPEIWAAQGGALGEAEAYRANEAGIQTMFLAVRIEHQGQVYGVLRLEIPLPPVLANARRALVVLALAAGLVALVVSAGAYLLARSISRPIEDLTQTVESLAYGNLKARSASSGGPQELQRLSVAFNRMANQLQENLDEMRSFVANASHELRTPLTTVKLRVEALRNGALEEPAVTEQFLSEIESEVDRLSRMVDDLLDLSRIEAGMASKQRSTLDLEMIAAEVIEMFTVRAQRAEVALTYHEHPPLPPVMGNEDQIRRVFYNLLDNAIKYTSHGGKVDLYLGLSKGGDNVCILVKDTGFGIPVEHQVHIFERFYRVEATRPRFGPPQGSGLGLPIAKSIVEIHGGRIGVESQVGIGSTFWVELPIYRDGQESKMGGSRAAGAQTTLDSYPSQPA
jgi:two-component system OmpR family sensor kinase